MADPGGIKRRIMAPDDAPADNQDAQQAEDLGKLIDTIEGAILPRLLLVHGGSDALRSESAAGSSRPTEEEIDTLAKLAMEEDAAVGLSFAQALHRDGLALEQVFLGLLGPAANRLGEWWESDDVTFTQVTIGLSRLHEILRDLSPGFERESSHREHGRFALLAPAPQEQHTFGMVMAAEFLRSAGWHVEDTMRYEELSITDTLRSNWFAILGLSLSSTLRTDELRNAIQRCRAASCNPTLKIMVGGNVFKTRPELVDAVGADAVALSGFDAVDQAEQLRLLN